MPICAQPKRAAPAGCNRPLSNFGLRVLDADAEHVEAHKAIEPFPAVKGRAGVDAEGNSAICSIFQFIKVSFRSANFGLAFDCDDEALM